MTTPDGYYSCRHCGKEFPSPVARDLHEPSCPERPKNPTPTSTSR